MIGSVRALGFGLILLAAVSVQAQPYWHVDTFNAENLNDNGAGNHAMWCGLATGDPRAAGYVHTPGYGNLRNVVLLFQATPADASMPDAIALDFFFNYDYEPGWGDMFIVEYDSAGTWTEVMQADKNDISGPVVASFLLPPAPLIRTSILPILSRAHLKAL